MKLFIRSVELHQSLNVQLLFLVGCCLIYEDVNSDGMFFSDPDCGITGR